MESPLGIYNACQIAAALLCREAKNIVWLRLHAIYDCELRRMYQAVISMLLAPPCHNVRSFSFSVPFIPLFSFKIASDAFRCVSV